MGDFEFDHPRLLHFLWALPVLTAICLWGFARKRRALARFATLNLLGSLVPGVSPGRQRFKALLTVLAVGALVIAMTGPRWGTHYQDIPSRGIDIVFALDVSNSMLAEDVVPNRLERAKLDIKDMLEVLPGDRVGLLTFAGKTTLSCPLTINYGSFRMALDAVNTRSAPVGGTLIGDAVRSAADAFTDKIKDHKAIIVVSDGGETDDSYAEDAARKAFEEQGIRVFTVGFGDISEGGRIPVMKDGKRVYLKDGQQEVWTKLEPGVLQTMAAVADGGYFSNIDFREMYARIAPKVAAREFESTRREMKYARFHWFAGLAMALLMIETMMTDRKVVAV